MGDILKAPENMTNPRDYVAPSMDNAQTEGSGKGQILKLSQEQIFNNASQGTGIAGPAVYGKTNQDNGSTAKTGGSKQSNDESVDLNTGQNSCWHGGRPYKG